MIKPDLLSLQIAPGSSALDDNPGWCEIGTKLQSFRYTRGRQFELDRVDAGTATFTLDATDRTLDPTYTKGPFYGRLLPNTQVRLQAFFNGADVYDGGGLGIYDTGIYDGLPGYYALFRGHIEQLPLSYTGPKYGAVDFECVDRMVALANAQINGSFPEQTTGARIAAVLAAAGWTTTQTLAGWPLGTGALGSTSVLASVVPTNLIDAGKATVAATEIAASGNVSALQHIQEVADTEPGVFYFDGSGRAVFRDRSHVTPTPEAAALTLTDDSTVADSTHVYYSDIVLTDTIERVYNDIELRAEDGSLVSATSALSIDQYWRRTLERSTQMRGTAGAAAELQQQAGYLLWGLKDGRVRIEQVTIPFATTTALTAVLGLELGDHVTVVRTPAGAAVSETITQESLVENIEIVGTPDAWTATLQLSPIPQTLTPWRLGTSHLGTETSLVYA